MKLASLESSEDSDDDDDTPTDQEDDVQEQLTEEETRKELDGSLESHAKLYREAHDLLQKKLRRGSEEVSMETLTGSLYSVHSSYFIYKDQRHKLQYNLEYKKKAGKRMVDSGLVHLLCDAVLETAETVRVARAARGDSKGLGEGLVGPVALLDVMLSILWSFTDDNPSVCEAVRSHGGLLPAIVIELDDAHSRYSKGTFPVR